VRRGPAFGAADVQEELVGNTATLESSDRKASRVLGVAVAVEALGFGFGRRHGTLVALIARPTLEGRVTGSAGDRFVAHHFLAHALVTAEAGLGAAVCLMAPYAVRRTLAHGPVAARTFRVKSSPLAHDRLLVNTSGARGVAGMTVR